jgi:hypothetical protein
VIARAGIEHEKLNSAGQAGEGTRKIALFVAGENYGGDEA